MTSHLLLTSQTPTAMFPSKKRRTIFQLFFFIEPEKDRGIGRKTFRNKKKGRESERKKDRTIGLRRDQTLV